MIKKYICALLVLAMCLLVPFCSASSREGAKRYTDFMEYRMERFYPDTEVYIEEFRPLDDLLSAEYELSELMDFSKAATVEYLQLKMHIQKNLPIKRWMKNFL